MTAALIRGNSLALPFADETVDLVVTSPPYFALRSYQDGGEHYDGQIGSEATPQRFVSALWAVTDELWRVLKPGGSVWVNLGDKYSGSGGHNNNGLGKSTLHGSPKHEAHHQAVKATRRSAPDRYNQDSGGVRAKSLMLLPERYRIGCSDPAARCRAETPWFLPSEVDHPQWIARAVVVWDKPNGLPESVTDRVRRSHEDWVHLTKAPRYYAAVDEIREAYAPGAWDKGERSSYLPGSASGSVDVNGSHVVKSDAGLPLNPLGKLPGSVWRIASEPLQVPEWVGVDHYAAFPQEFPRRIILGWTPPGYCTECGQPRQAVVEKELRVDHVQNRKRYRESLAEDDSSERIMAHTGGKVGSYEATITGYRCGCPTPDAPTRPAVVLDPFAGTGTSVMVARALGRYGVGVDLSADYLRLARWRIWQSGHATKTTRRTWDERQGALL